MFAYRGVAFLISLSLCSVGEAMRCGDQLVYTGDSQYNILQKCGDPQDKQSYEEIVPLYSSEGNQIGSTTNLVERWIYQKSPVDFQYTLTFDAGILKNISANRNPY